MITVAQKKWTKETGWQDFGKNNLSGKPQLVLAFGGSSVVSQPGIYEEIKKLYPESPIVIASTAGEILDTQVFDNSIVLTALAFQSSSVVCHGAVIASAGSSEQVGQELGAKLTSEKLVHVMVFSDGLHVNGTAFVRGLAKSLPGSVAVTGGLAGDGADFKQTYLGLNETAVQDRAVIIGFYGDNLRAGYGSFGGWDPFGPERQITKSEGNVLFELDGKSALSLYKEYLGEKARELPGSGLLFPLSLSVKSSDGNEEEVVRTLLSVDEEKDSMTFAGDMPTGVYAKLMKANFDNLIDGASSAANMSLKSLNESPDLAILISCVGRKLLLKERVEEEVESVRQMLGSAPAMVGFYSYGEICPTAPTEKQCRLHNQTMTITILKEQ